MCVIAYKAKDVRFPSERNVRAMWEHNPDGAGVMWRDPATNRIRYEKGFMRLKSLEEWIARNRAWLADVECALHFRITTHGGTSPGNCHPFVCATDADPHALAGEADRVLMHNGILPLVPRSKDISDSAELALRLGGISDPEKSMESLDECLKGNRIILMDADGTHFHGDRFRPSEDGENAGILYSNLNHETSARAFSLCGKWEARDGCVTQSFDADTGAFRDLLTGREVPFEEVDPYALSDDDYDVWEDAYYGDAEISERAHDLGISVEDYRNVEEEAQDYGMSAEDYYYWMYEGDDAYSPYAKRETA